MGLIHTHCLSNGLIGSLIKAIQFVKANNRNEFHLQRDLDLTHNEYANFQKLHYFALCVRKEGKSGYWLITKWGGAFLRNELAIPYKVETLDNIIQRKSMEMRMIKDYFPAYDTGYFQTNFHSVLITNQQALII